MRVVDCVPFFNEVEILRARLAILPADRHVVMEAHETHQGRPKPLHLDGVDLPNVERFAVHLPNGDDHWLRERHQRDALAGHLAGIDPDDLVLSCDVDEIPNPDAMDRIAEMTEQGPVRLGMRMLYYGLDWEHAAGWSHAVAFRAQDIPVSLSKLRLSGGLRRVVPDAGWHVSYWGGRERRRAKVEAFAHAENRAPHVMARIDSGAETGPNGERLTRVDRSTLPGTLVEMLG